MGWLQIYSGRLGVKFVVFCSFWRLFTIKMIKSVKVFPFSFWKIIRKRKCLLHKIQTPGINMQNGRQVISLLGHKLLYCCLHADAFLISLPLSVHWKNNTDSYKAIVPIVILFAIPLYDPGQSLSNYFFSNLLYGKKTW